MSSAHRVHSVHSVGIKSSVDNRHLIMLITLVLFATLYSASAKRFGYSHPPMTLKLEFPETKVSWKSVARKEFGST